MTILAVDTSESHCSAALLKDDGRGVHKMEDIGRGHAERLLPMVEELLAEISLGYSDISRIAVVTGPGTFTGLRIGLSVARGLALALSVPCVGLMSLPVLAACAAKGPNSLTHVVTKGRGGQVFYQTFRGLLDNGLPASLIEAQNIDADKAATLVQSESGVLCGSGAAHVLELLGKRAAVSTVAVDPLVLAKLSRNLPADSFSPEPTYLRQADAAKAKAVFNIQLD